MPASKTIYDVARESGVSIGTVSRVMNNRHNVAPETRRQVLAAAKRLGFMPQLTTRRITVGLVMQEIETVHEVGYAGSVICELINHAARRGVVLEVVPLKELERVYQHYTQGLIGLVFGPATERLLKIQHIPVFLINNIPAQGTFHVVATDHAQGARLGTEYLLKKGHRRIALVQIESDEWGARERERGFREAFLSAGVPVPKELIVYLESRPVDETLGKVLLGKPTALFTGGEDLSIAILEELGQRLKLRVPRDISLLTYEIPVVSKILTPSQTTIAQPWPEMARLALDGLLNELRAPSAAPLRTLLGNRLIERGSVRDIRP